MRMRWRFYGANERRKAPRVAVTTPEDEASKTLLRQQAVSLEEEIRTILLELEAGVYARDQDWRGTHG